MKIISLIVVTMFLTSCKDTPPGVGPAILVETITLELSNPYVGVGDTVEITVTIEPANASDTNIVWTSSMPTVAKVTSDGKIIGVSVGSTQIVAQSVDENVTKTLVIKVLVPVSSVTITGESQVKIGGILPLTATVAPAAVVDKTIVWRSSDEDKATVGKGGNVEGVSSGMVMITATSVFGMVSDTQAIVVLQPVTGVSPSVPAQAIAKDDTVQLSVIIAPVDATDQSVMWSSSNNTIATVDADGSVIGIAPGNVIISATPNDEDFTGSPANFVVNVTTASVRINKAVTKTIVRGTITFTVTSASGVVMWSSSDDDIASINSMTGVLTGVGVGNVVITATSTVESAAKNTIMVSVGVAVAEISVTGFTTVGVNKSIFLSATVLPLDAKQEIRWTSSDENTVTVSNNGLVTGIAEGTATITATATDGSSQADMFMVEVTTGGIGVYGYMISGVPTGTNVGIAETDIVRGTSTTDLLATITPETNIPDASLMNANNGNSRAVYSVVKGSNPLQYKVMGSANLSEDCNDVDAVDAVDDVDCYLTVVVRSPANDKNSLAGLTISLLDRNGDVIVGSETVGIISVTSAPVVAYVSYTQYSLLSFTYRQKLNGNPLALRTSVTQFVRLKSNQISVNGGLGLLTFIFSEQVDTVINILIALDSGTVFGNGGVSKTGAAISGTLDPLTKLSYEATFDKLSVGRHFKITFREGAIVLPNGFVSKRIELEFDAVP